MNDSEIKIQLQTLEPLKLSVVIPCYNEQEIFGYLRSEMEKFVKVLTGKGFLYELILIDDGSKDMTWIQIQDWAAENSNVRGVSFSRNFGQQAAMTCGYELAVGDAVVTIDADLQDPPEVMFEMIEKWQAGADIVFTQRESRAGETFFKIKTADLYYRLLHWIGLTFIERNCGDYRLMNRKSVDAFNSLRERNRMLRGMIGWVGFKTEKVLYARRARTAGTTKYSVFKLIALAMDGIISFSLLPLKLCYVLSLLTGAVAFSYLAFTVIRWYFYDYPVVEGWSSLVTLVTLFGMMNLFCVGILGEYIGRIYTEVKERPLYVVRMDTR